MWRGRRIGEVLGWGEDTSLVGTTRLYRMIGMDWDAKEIGTLMV